MNTTDYFTYINAMFLFCIFTCGLLFAVSWRLINKSDALKKEQDAHLKATNTNTLLNKALSAKNAGLQANEHKLRDAEKEIRALQYQLDNVQKTADHYIDLSEQLQQQLAAAKRVRNAKGVFVRKDGTFTPKVKPLPTIADEVIYPYGLTTSDSETIRISEVIEAKKKTESQPKPHTLRHGMTVKNPTKKEAKEIFEAARKAGIKIYREENSSEYPWIWFAADLITVCVARPAHSDIYITPSEFIARIKGEVG